MKITRLPATRLRRHPSKTASSNSRSSSTNDKPVLFLKPDWNARTENRRFCYRGASISEVLSAPKITLTKHAKTLKNVWGVPPSRLRNHQNMLKGCLRLVAGFGIATNNRKRKIEWCCFTVFSCMLYMPNSSLRTCRKCYTGASNWRSWWKYWCFRKPFWNPFRKIVDFAIGVPQNGRSLSHSAESWKNIKKRLRGASISMPIVLYVWCFWHYFGPWAIAKSLDRWSKSMKFKAPSLFHEHFFFCRSVDAPSDGNTTDSEFRPPV